MLSDLCEQAVSIDSGPEGVYRNNLCVTVVRCIGRGSRVQPAVHRIFISRDGYLKDLSKPLPGGGAAPAAGARLAADAAADTAPGGGIHLLLMCKFREAESRCMLL